MGRLVVTVGVVEALGPGRRSFDAALDSAPLTPRS